jgi:hypothetical protein
MLGTRSRHFACLDFGTRLTRFRSAWLAAAMSDGAARRRLRFTLGRGLAPFAWLGLGQPRSVSPNRVGPLSGRSCSFAGVRMDPALAPEPRALLWYRPYRTREQPPQQLWITLAHRGPRTSDARRVRVLDLKPGLAAACAIGARPVLRDDSLEPCEPQPDRRRPPPRWRPARLSGKHARNCRPAEKAVSQAVDHTAKSATGGQGMTCHPSGPISTARQCSSVRSRQT